MFGTGDFGMNMTAMVNRVASELQNTTFYEKFVADLQTCVAVQPIEKENLAAECLDFAKKSNADVQLRNALFHLVQRNQSIFNTHGSKEHQEPLEYLRKAQNSWDRRLIKCLNSMACELCIPLARHRSKQEQEDLKNKWKEMFTDSENLSEIRPVYAAKDFLEVLSAIRNPNYSENTEENLWGLIQVPLKTRDLKALADFYGELAACAKHSGLCAAVAGEYKTHIPLAVERLILGQKVLERNHGPMSREFCKQGCPPALRSQLWLQILGIEINEATKCHFDQMRNLVLSHDLLVDRLIKKDIQLTCSNDDHYFVFEDCLNQILLSFFRDGEVQRDFERKSSSAQSSVPSNQTGTSSLSNNFGPDVQKAFPPCGVVPFHGFAMYAIPLCCLYEDPVEIYLIFREMYQRYWNKLHAINSHPQGALSLCLQFEQLLQSNETKLWMYCLNTGIQLLPIAFRWMMRGFSGYLCPEQLFHLWDIILAWSSLEILPVLALAIVSFRRDNLMDITSQQAAEAVLSDISVIKVIPLIKLAFTGERFRD